jgi:signal transduction histidine kinase
MTSIPAVVDQPLHRAQLTAAMPLPRATAFLRTGPVLGLAIAAAIAYYLGAVAGLRLRIGPAPTSVLWPPNALLTLLLLFVPVRRWWSVLAGAAIAHVAIQLPMFSPGFVTLIFLTNCSEALIAAGLVRAFSDEPTRFGTLRGTSLFIVFGAVAGPFFSSFLDAGVVAFFNHEQYWAIWKLRFVSNVLAQLALVPAIAGLLNSSHRIGMWPTRRRVQAILIGVGFVLLSVAARLDPGHIGFPNSPLAFCIPLLLWAAVSFGSPGVGLAVFATVVLTTVDTVVGEGFLPGVPRADRVRMLQLLLISFSVPLMCVGALIEERESALAALRESDLVKSSILAALPDMIFVIRRDGTYVDCHAKDSTLLYAAPATFIGKTVNEIMPPELAALFMSALGRAALTDHPVVVEYEMATGGEPRQFEARIVRMGHELLLTIVRDVSESKHALELVHDLAGRLIASQEVERRRIARELHDDLSQKVALLSIGIDQLAGEFSPAREHLNDLTERTREIASDIRSLSHELHPARLELVGLTTALRTLCEDTSRQTGVRVLFTGDVLPHAMHPDVSLSVYRIAQEALHNIARHSGSVAADVRLTRQESMLTLEISDTGAGFHLDTQHTGLGLISMRERVTFLGGQLMIQTAPGRGTRVRVQVPMGAVSLV